MTEKRLYNAYRRSGGRSGFLFYFLIIFASFWAGSSFVTFLSGVVTYCHALVMS
ncbi:hypothetical protein NC653_022210 [Populus alba x Populus x berolinensis]|uniref:Uncharacterized protein n=1 Tax=Populus alba x Populus x berolinensis TaxID=444605 RepID=A0AAD6QFS1_9ROSI|nr:hypothetical protein NC653_022210 [Populus alba x Populus x berolinensis]